MFIVLYGINNLGKTTQAKKLVERLNAEGHAAEYIKYSMYDLAPSGPLINNYLRGGNTYELSAREAQLLHTMNRTQYEPTLTRKLNADIHIVAEDYVGTSIAWGVADGVDETFLKTVNVHTRREDLSFLLHGARFLDAVEDGHRHETDEALIARAADIHRRLGEEYGWIPIDANQPMEAIHSQLWSMVRERLS